MVQLKAGHPPAQRVGNMRIKSHKRSPSRNRLHRNSESDDLDNLSSSPKQVVISGAVTKGDVDFSPEAIKSYHDKCASQFDFRSVQKNRIIQQPKKM